MTVTYARRLGLYTATNLVIGGIIGSGIFLNPAIVAARVGTAALTLTVWVVGGIVALLGAFIFAELGARRPGAGGGYVYLREAFGPFPAFLYAWALFLIIAPGAIAAVAVTFATYATALLGLSQSIVLPVALGAILFLSFVNYLGVAPAAITQNIFTILKLLAILTLVAVGLFGPSGGSGADMAVVHAAAGSSGLLAFGSALVPVLFAYGGWQQTNFVAAELREAKGNLPRALVIGVGVVVLAYLLANMAYLRILGPAGLAESNAPAADLITRVLGTRGGTLISAGIAASTFGFLDLVILVSPRVYQTMAADGLFFAALARLHPRYQTPAAAIGLQALWAVTLTLTGTYADLLDYVVFADWIFFGLTALALVVFRRQESRNGGAAGFRTPGYPVTLILFVAAALCVVVGSVTSNPANALKGTGLLVAGIPAFGWWQSRQERENGERGTGEARKAARVD